MSSNWLKPKHTTVDQADWLQQVWETKEEPTISLQVCTGDGIKCVFLCQFLLLNYCFGQWDCAVGQTTLMPCLNFLPKLKPSAVCVGFSSILNSCSGLFSLRVLTCTDVHMPTPKLKPFPSFPHSPPHNKIPMWEMSQQLRGKANQRNLLPVQNEGWPLDWGSSYCKRAYKKDNKSKHAVRVSWGRGGGLAQIIE